MALHPVFPINITEHAQLILCPCPGTQGVDLSTSLQQLSQAGAPALLTMMTSEELEKNGLANMGPTAVHYDMQWFHLPIEDDSVPNEAWEARFNDMLPRFKQIIAQGSHLVVHCKGGSGRTGLTAARLLMEYGFSSSQAIELIRSARPNAFSIEAQRHYIQQFDK